MTRKGKQPHSMAPPVPAGNKIHVKPVDCTDMASDDGSCSEKVPHNPQRELPNDRLDKYLREQGARTKYMIMCMAVLLPVCLSSAGVLMWHVDRTADALSKLQILVEQRVGEEDATIEESICFQDKLNSSLAESIEQLYNKTDASTKKMMEFILEVADTNRIAHDCVDLLRYGFTTSGMYHIHPPGGPQTGNDVWCDMQTDGGGWIVIQRRQNGAVDFYRDWQSYKDGFGNPSDEFWIGNDVLHRLTSCSDLQLRVDLWSWENETAHAEYSSFTTGDESSNYVLGLGNYIGGNASDAMTYHNGKRFSTFDRDNDGRAIENCAVAFGGAWWYNACFHSNLNGQYSINSSVPHGFGIIWKQWKGSDYSLMKTEMKLRRS